MANKVNSKAVRLDGYDLKLTGVIMISWIVSWLVLVVSQNNISIAGVYPFHVVVGILESHGNNNF